MIVIGAANTRAQRRLRSGVVTIHVYDGLVEYWEKARGMEVSPGV